MSVTDNSLKEPRPLNGSSSKKRKASNDHDHTKDAPERRKKAKSKKTKSSNDDHLDLDAGLNTAFAAMNPPLVADFLAQKTRRFEPDLSAPEQEDRRIPGMTQEGHKVETAICDTTSWEKPRTLENLADFMRRFSTAPDDPKRLSSAPKKKGHPHTIFITAAGLRAADLTRALRTFQTRDAAVAKLFAKHIKLKEALEYVKSTRMTIGVGTPMRLADLVDAEALSLDKVNRIVVDSSYIDIKKRGIFDMRETLLPLMAFLNRPALKDRYDAASRSIQLLFY
ncbi:MAG: hypothetical protein M1825_005314 [Sarcosagium campestre]|nr:MAG: hypothetical protein M1825_005314 [Sarcosagium campestre]